MGKLKISLMNRYNIDNMIKRVLIFLLVLLFISGCQKEWEPNLITDINDLEGRKVGVNLAWEADYILTPRADMQLFRYDSTPDMLLALGYDKVDAIAVDDSMWRMMDKNSEGLIKIEPEIKKTGYGWIFKDKQLRDEFNAFLKEFKKTETYQKYLQSEANFEDDYEEPEIIMSGKGKVLKVAFDISGYPRAFREPGETTATGFDFEPLKHFANACDYQLEYIGTVYDDSVMGLKNGVYDIGGGYFSIEYAGEAESLGLFVSDPMDEVPVYFVQKIQRDITIDLEAMGE